MQTYSFLLAIAGVLLVGAMSPGPSFIVVAQNALSKSRAHGIATAVGTALGVAIFAILASFGVTLLLDKVPSAFQVFKIVGGAYLLYLAFLIWRAAKQSIASQVEVEQGSKSYLRAFLTGLITQTSNPKTALVIAGIFAAFVPSSPPPNTVIYVALIAFIIDFSWYAIVATTLSSERSKNIYTRAKSNIDRVAAIFLAIVGVRLMFI